MNKEFSLSRPTSKRTLRWISIISVLLTMTLIWLLICVASVLTLKQYAQKNLDLTATTITHGLEAARVFSDHAAAAETLATLGRQGQFSAAEVRDKNGRIIASWRYDARAVDDTLIGLISHWLFPLPVSQPVWHNGRAIGEVRLVAHDSLIGHFIWLSLAVLSGCILLASGIALLLTRYLHNGVVDALHNITEVVHDVRNAGYLMSVLRNFTFLRRISIACWMRWKNGSYGFTLKTHSYCVPRCTIQTGLANRAALLFLGGENFKYINETWGHAAGDRVLIEVSGIQW